jgi:hypothetical protein
MHLWGREVIDTKLEAENVKGKQSTGVLAVRM